jgi:hypothetical protein
VSEYRDRVADTLHDQVAQLRSLLTELTETSTGWELSLTDTSQPPGAAPPSGSEPFDTFNDGTQPGAR